LSLSDIVLTYMYVLSKYRRLRLVVNSRDFQRDRKIERWSS